MSEEAITSVTKDFRLLPGTDLVSKRIDEDANAVTIIVQNNLIDLVKNNNDGRAVYKHDIPLLYREKVLGSLRRWAKMQNYKLHYKHGEFSLTPKNIKYLSDHVSKCKLCGKTRSKFTTSFLHRFAGFFGWGAGAGSVIAVATMATHWAFIIVSLLCLGTGASIGLLATENKYKHKNCYNCKR